MWWKLISYITGRNVQTTKHVQYSVMSLLIVFFIWIFFSLLYLSLTRACISTIHMSNKRNTLKRNTFETMAFSWEEKKRTDAFTHRFYYLNRKVIENANRRCRNILERRAEKTESETNWTVTRLPDVRD
jgi:hypothetical protein